MLCKYMKQFEHKKHSSTTALASNTQFFFFVNVAAQTALLCLLCSSAQQKDAAEVWLHKNHIFISKTSILESRLSTQTQNCFIYLFELKLFKLSKLPK